MAIRWGVSPIGWINDDMPDLGSGTTLHQILGDAQAIGFDGIELGHLFPRDAAVLGPILAAYGLALAAGWYGARLLTRSAEEEIAAMQGHLGLLEALGTDVFVIAEVSNAIHTDRSASIAARPQLDEATWPLFTARLDAVGDYLAARGFSLAYHHHLGTVVQTGDDIQRLLWSTGGNVGLTIDTGHAVLADFDPTALVRLHPDRIHHVHCKDTRPHAATGLSDRCSFLDGVLAGMFTVPGDGNFDFGPFLDALAAVSYDGWIIVEAEQDPASAPPRSYHRMGLDTLLRRSARPPMEIG